MSKEIATKKDKELAVPSYMSSFAGQGAEDISADLVEKSFLQLAHEDKDDAKFGEWYNSTTGESHGKDVVITVCKITRNWRKFNSDFQLEASSTDGLNWDNGDKISEDEKWQCAFIDMFVLLNESADDMPSIVSFRGTSFKTGKKLATTLARFARGCNEPIFARNYTLSSDEAKKGSKSYAVAKYKMNPGFNSEQTVKIAAKVRQLLDNISPVMTNIENDEPSEIEID
jgi:hypothetical protein